MIKTLSSLYRRGVELHRPLALTTAGMAAMAVVSAALIFLDPRLITGAPAWVKPFKFFVSVSVYTATWLWMGSMIDSRGRAFRRCGNITAFVLNLEMALVLLQVLRGTRSHFNNTTIFNTAVTVTMGVAITVLWISNVVLAVMLLRKRFADPVLSWGVRLGVLSAILGMGSGYLMVMPKPEQIAEQRAAGHTIENGGHAVGAPDDGPAYPLVNWSRTGGDLRPAHFVGLHGMQVLPLLALALSRRRSRTLGAGHRVALVGTATFGWLGLMGVLLVQALRAQPIFQPDAVTLGMLGALLAVVAAGTLAITAHARLTARTAPESMA